MMSQARANVAKATKKALAAGALMAALLMGGLVAPPAHASSTTFTVNSTADLNDQDFPRGTFDGSSDGVCDADAAAEEQCTLRAAIQEANETAGADTINFHISGTGVHTISPTSPLPFITKPVTINGYSQPGSSANTLAKGTNAKLLIEIDGTNSGAGGGSGGLTIVAPNTVVKGLVINRFLEKSGIAIFSETAADVVTNVRIEGNFIGTDPSGTIDRHNGGSGVLLFATSNNTIGGTSRAARNLISANDFEGVLIEGSSISAADNNKVVGNLIGGQRDGAHALGNGTEGVGVIEDIPDSADGNRILSNSIFASGLLGIDLGEDGPTPNDSADKDSGPNGLQNKPVVGSAKTISGKTTIRGRLSTKAQKTFVVRFFSNPADTNEGKTFIGQKKVTTGKDGKASFTFSPAKKVGVGKNVTATATGSEGTSEFSAPKKVVAA